MGERMFLVVAVVAAAILFSAVVDGAPVHHVVGEDRGWDPSTDVASWSSGRVFRVGDKIWFTYSAADESIVELKSEEEFTSCDLTNPIKMYTDGLDKVSLEGEGIRYFASGNQESCQIGLKIPVKVQPKEQNVGSAMAVAAGPTLPSGSTSLNGLSYLFTVGLLLCIVGL